MTVLVLVLVCDSFFISSPHDLLPGHLSPGKIGTVGLSRRPLSPPDGHRRVMGIGGEKKWEVLIPDDKIEKRVEAAGRFQRAVLLASFMKMSGGQLK